MYRVVIADDEVLIRMYIREILENNGYEVVGEAEDGLDAIAVCRQKKPDFVIMDINMPVMTGLEATKVINEDKLAGFVIILTAYRDKEIADQAAAGIRNTHRTMYKCFNLHIIRDMRADLLDLS